MFLQLMLAESGGFDCNGWITMLAWPLLHLHVLPECHEDLHYVLFGFLFRGVPQQVSRHSPLHSDFEQR